MSGPRVAVPVFTARDAGTSDRFLQCTTGERAAFPGGEREDAPDAWHGGVWPVVFSGGTSTMAPQERDAVKVPTASATDF